MRKTKRSPTRSAYAPRTYVLAGKVLEKQADGSVIVRRTRAGEPLARIDAPWGKDAAGRPVTTWYELYGDRLIQKAEITADTRFPVTLDPSVRRRWWGHEVRFNRGETITIAASTAACGIVLTGIGLGMPVGVVCAGIAGFASAALANGKCIGVKVPWVGPSVPWVENC